MKMKGNRLHHVGKMNFAIYPRKLVKVKKWIEMEAGGAENYGKITG